MRTKETIETRNAALASTAWHVERDPVMAIKLARGVLVTDPSNARARLYLGAALRRVGELGEASQLLQRLSTEVPNTALVWFELGLLHATRGDTSAAVEALSKAVSLKPDFGEARSALSAQQALAGFDAAPAAASRNVQAGPQGPVLIEAGKAIATNNLQLAEQLLRGHLRAQPNDFEALRTLADVSIRAGHFSDAVDTLTRCLSIAPDSAAARHSFSLALHYEGKYAAAIEQANLLLASDPENPAYYAVKAAASVQIGDYDQAIACYRAILNTDPNQLRTWLNYGDALQATGQLDAAIETFRSALRYSPTSGEVYWSLANLKTFRFSADDIATMSNLLLRRDLGENDRFHTEFALGKAFEDERRYAEAFEMYRSANALRRKTIAYDAASVTKQFRRSIEFFTAAFFAERRDQGEPAADPIFIVGLPRSGSTLIEQILASHSSVEGTMELPELYRIVKKIGGDKPAGQRSDYPEALAARSAADLRALGGEYLERTRSYRTLGRPFFIDKDPNNFADIGLIHLILPNAKIVDVRRHPLGCCFSGFKQHFARGQGFSYDLADLGRYYVDYVGLMAHFDDVLPGRIHRVFYEQLINEPDAEIRRLLAYCGLPFEEQCLRFHDTRRPIRTPSSEQVRQPLFRDAVEQWRHFEPWLGPLKAALGRTIEEYEHAASQAR